jgi:hypothetical protein
LSGETLAESDVGQEDTVKARERKSGS